MDQLEAMKARHSVRQYQNKPLEADVISTLQKEVESLHCNRARLWGKSRGSA